MVRKIKDSKKEPNKKQDEREKGWDDRFIYNKLEDNVPEKKPLSKKNDFSSNINYLRQQFGNEKINQRKSTKKRGKSGYKFIQEKNNSNIYNKNKIRIKSNNILKYNNLVDLNNTDNTNANDILSLLGENKIGIIGNDNNIANKSNNSTNFIRNNNYINVNNTSNIYNNMSLDELEVYIGILWNKLGVKVNYQKTFNELKEEKENEEAKREIMILEIQNLEKMENFLNDLGSHVESRDKTILLLKKLIEVMEKQFISIDLDIKESVINDFHKAITAYRVNTIKVIKGIEMYNQLFSYNINKGKFDEDYLVRKSKLYDKENNIKNYLLKIKDDLNFLGYSKINGYKQLNLNFSKSDDPFLLSVLEQIPFNLDDYNYIKQCQYIIMQEVIFDSMNSKMDNKNNNSEANILDFVTETGKKKKLEPIINNNNSSVVSNNNSKITKNENINRNNNNDDRKRKENNKIKKTEKIVIETQLIDKNNYENFFGNSNSIEESDEQILEKLKTDLNAVNAYNKYKKENSKIQIDSGNINNNKSNDIVNDKKDHDNDKLKSDEKLKKNENIENNNKIIKKTDNKENEDKKDIYKEKENNKISEDIEVIKEDIKNEEKTDNMTIGKIEDKDNNEDFVNIDENININEEQNKINNFNGNKDNNIEENILENSLVISKKINPTKEHNRSSTPKSLRNSKIITTKEMNQNQKNNLNKDNNTPEVKDEIIIQSNRDNDYIAFYCGKISNFISIYSSYYNTIPEEQKIIFNLKSEPLEYIHNNFFPKIIIYSDKKTSTIKGLCIFSFIFTNESKNNGIFIEHISSYNEEEQEKIFEKLFSYIKENSYSLFGFENSRKEKEIYIDLYYKNEDGKFKINTEIRDFFRNQLKFKWVKLENLSKYVRYQKMRHQFMINSGNSNANLLNNEYDDNNILNQSILGRKEFNNEENGNESEGEEESEDDEINTDISRIFDKDNFNDKESIDMPFNDKDSNNVHPHNKFNLLNNFSIKNKTVLKFNKRSFPNKNNNNKN